MNITEHIKEKYKDCIGTVCLCMGDTSLRLLLGFDLIDDRKEEDIIGNDFDSYFITLDENGVIKRTSMVGFLIPLKKRLNDEEYKCVEATFTRNIVFLRKSGFSNEQLEQAYRLAVLKEPYNKEIHHNI